MNDEYEGKLYRFVDGGRIFTRSEALQQMEMYVQRAFEAKAAGNAGSHRANNAMAARIASALGLR